MTLSHEVSSPESTCPRAPPAIPTGALGRHHSDPRRAGNLASKSGWCRRCRFIWNFYKLVLFIASNWPSIPSTSTGQGK